MRGACPYKSTIQQNTFLVRTFGPHNVDKPRPAPRNRHKTPCHLARADSVWQAVKCVCVSCTFGLSCQRTSAPSLTACNFNLSLSRQASACVCVDLVLKYEQAVLAELKAIAHT